MGSLLGTNISHILAEVTKLKAVKKTQPVISSQAALPTVSQEKIQTLSPGVRLWVARTNGDTKTLREEIENRLSRKEAEICVVIGIHEGSAILVAGVDRKKAEAGSAGDIVKKLLPFIDGRGGGSPQFAQGTGMKIDGIEDVLKQASAITEKLLLPVAPH